MTATSTPPGIPSVSRLAGWIGESLGGEPAEPAELAGIQLIAGGRSNLMEYVPGVVLRSRQDTAALTLVARAHQVLDADD